MAAFTKATWAAAWPRIGAVALLSGVLIACLIVPGRVWETLVFVGHSLFAVAPLVIPGVFLAAWITASGASSRIATRFDGRIFPTVIFASLAGAITPVCGVTVLPLMVGLLASGVPLAPVMAFWLSSPITDPAMLTATAGTLGVGFAIGKTVAAFGLGLLGGGVSALAGASWTQEPLRRNWIGGLVTQQPVCSAQAFQPTVWRDGRSRVFWRETGAITRLILICLIPAFAAEYWLNEMLSPAALAVVFGSGAWWSVPLSVLAGAPAYLDGYAALPLTRAMLDHGMSPGAAMAFLVSGGAVSIWGAIAIFPVLRFRPFLLYLGLALAGSMIAGWTFELLS